jgi:hypothetical protein
LQNRYSGRELPQECPPYLDEVKWAALVAHLGMRESYFTIATREGVKEEAIRNRCNAALTALHAHGDLRIPVNVDVERLDKVIAHYNDVVRVVGDGALNIPMRREDVEWMLDTLILIRR